MLRPQASSAVGVAWQVALEVGGEVARLSRGRSSLRSRAWPSLESPAAHQTDGRLEGSWGTDVDGAKMAPGVWAHREDRV